MTDTERKVCLSIGDTRRKSIPFKDAWAYSPEEYDLQWAACWIVPGPADWESKWGFTPADVVERVNQMLEGLCAEFRFVPDPDVSNGRYLWMEMRDHAQAFAVATLGRMVARMLWDEKASENAG